MPYKDPKTGKPYASKVWYDKNINPITGKSFAEEKRKAQVAGKPQVKATTAGVNATGSVGTIGTWTDSATGQGYSGKKRNANDKSVGKTPTGWQSEIAKGLDPAWVKANVNPKTGKTYAEEKREAQVAIKEPLIEPLDEPEPFIRPPEPLIDPGKVPEMVVDSGALREKEAFGEKGEEEERQKNIKEIEDLTTQQQLKNLRVEAGLDPDTGEKLDKPAIPTFETDFDALRDEHGMSALESQINNLNSSIADAEASLRLGMYDEEGKLKPMELIGAAQEKLVRQGREAVDALLRRKQVLVDEYNTKLNVVNSLMQFSQLDYNAAVADYNTQFNQNIQLLNILEGREDDADREKNVEIDNARANLTLITNVAKTSGQTWDELDPDMQSQITALEIKSGLPAGITQAFMEAMPEAEVMAETISYDAEGNQIVTFIYKGADGKPSTVEVVKTGGYKAPAGTGVGDGGGTIVDDGTKDGIDLSTPEGMAWAKEQGRNYEDVYAYLDKNTKWSAGVISDKLKRAGFQTVEQEAKASERSWEDGEIISKIREFFDAGDSKKEIKEALKGATGMTDADLIRANELIEEKWSALEQLKKGKEEREDTGIKKYIPEALKGMFGTKEAEAATPEGFAPIINKETGEEYLPETAKPQYEKGIMYVIESGDTLSEIAEKHGISQKELEYINKIKDPNKIQAGKALKIPVPYGPIDIEIDRKNPYRKKRIN